MAGETSGLASQVFALAKGLARVEQDVEQLGERGTKMQETLAQLDLSPVQEAVGRLEERTGALEGEVQALAPLTESIASLASKVAQLRKDLEALAAGKEEKLMVWDWSWNGMDRDQAADAWETLVNWVREELADRYGWVGPPADVLARTSYGVPGQQLGAPARIPPCWYRHREAVAELSWLCQEWHRIYKTSYGTPAKAGDWHDRWAPNVRKRLTAALTKCADRGHTDDDWFNTTNHPAAPRGTDDDEALSNWVRWDLKNRRPGPSEGR